MRLLYLLLALPLALPAQCPNLLWSDEFDGTTLDLASWTYELGDGCERNLCGWGNNELQVYNTANTTVADGMLTITARREASGAYTSSRIVTKGKRDFRYGRYEARIRVPAAGGSWPAFWMLPTDNVYGAWPQSGEIDIMEYIGNDPDELLGTLHFGPPWPNNKFTGGKIEWPDALHKDFHVYAIEWEPNEIRWFIDGIQYSRKTRSDLSPDRWPFDQDFHIILNVAVGGNLGGNVNSSQYPSAMEVDYVRVYEGKRPTVEGPLTVSEDDASVNYRINNAGADARVEWSALVGSKLLSDTTGTSANFSFGGNEEALISATVITDCDTSVIEVPVNVRAGFSLDYSLEPFDSDGRVAFDFATGVLTEVDNPEPGQSAGSGRVGRYARAGGETFDVLVYKLNNVSRSEIGEYVDSERRFEMDVLSEAPVGTEILIQLESSAARPSNYPTGRHSRYRAVTGTPGEWNRLEFELLDQPDPSVLNSSVNTLIILFRPNSNTSDTYFFDNLDSYLQGELSSTGSARLPRLDVTVSPNPLSGRVAIVTLTPSVAQRARLDVSDASGRTLSSDTIQLSAGQQNVPVDLSGLAAGVYTIGLTGQNFRAAARLVIPE